MECGNNKGNTPNKNIKNKSSNKMTKNTKSRNKEGNGTIFIVRIGMITRCCSSKWLETE
jgi:homospermidine synthase